MAEDQGHKTADLERPVANDDAVSDQSARMVYLTPTGTPYGFEPQSPRLLDGLLGTLAPEESLLVAQMVLALRRLDRGDDEGEEPTSVQKLMRHHTAQLLTSVAEMLQEPGNAGSSRSRRKPRTSG